MFATISKRFTFDAAHQLPHHDGKCKRPHGHTYIVEIEARGQIQTAAGPKQGMVADFGDIKAAYNARVHSRVDHQDLNVVLADEIPCTTAEWIAAWILSEMRDELPDVAISCVRVYETPTCFAEVRV